MLPILQRLSTGPRGAVRALVLAPTRELASQIHNEIGTLARFSGARSTTIFGGVSAQAQIRALRDRPDIVVACPGRLLDLWQSKDVRLDKVEVLVLDEADHMFDMGFLPTVKRILAALPKRRQNLMFSATMPDEIRGLASHVLDHPHVIELAHSQPLETIEHALYTVDETRKTDLLCHVLGESDFSSAIVFLRTKHRAKRLAQRLDDLGYSAVALQGNMSQSQRERAMGGFRSGRFNVLVATDIAARGIDVEGVSHVINYDLPGTPEAYTHRIGRTGRSERLGKARTFVTGADHDGIRAIERKLGAPIPRLTAAGLDSRPPSPRRRPAQRGPEPRGPAQRDPGRAHTARARQAGGPVHSHVSRQPRAHAADENFGEGVLEHRPARAESPVQHTRSEPAPRRVHAEPSHHRAQQRPERGAPQSTRREHGTGGAHARPHAAPARGQRSAGGHARTDKGARKSSRRSRR